MSTHQFAVRLQAKLEATSEFWRNQKDVTPGIALAVLVALAEVADSIRHVLSERKPKARKRNDRADNH